MSQSFRREPRRVPQVLGLILASGVIATAAGCAATCQERCEAAAEEIESARSNFLTCGADSDCAMADVSTTCRGACPAVVATAGESALRKTIAEANRSHCEGFRGTCAYATVGCALATAACSNGVCVARY